jgi:hypothetical protein
LKELTIHKDEWTNTDYQYASLVNWPVTSSFSLPLLYFLLWDSRKG